MSSSHEPRIKIIRILSISVISILALSMAQAADAQVVHENPGYLKKSTIPDVDTLRDLSLEGMIISINDFAYNISKSDFDAANESLYRFDMYGKKYVSALYQMNDSEFMATSAMIKEITGDMSLFLNGTGRYEELYPVYIGLLEKKDVKNATDCALKLNAAYNDINKANSNLGNNASYILDIIENTSIDTYQVQEAYGFFSGYMETLKQRNMLVENTLGDTVISIKADKEDVSIGESILFTATLATKNDTPVAGSIIRFFLNDKPIGSAATGSDGNSSVAYTVPVTIYTSRLRFYAGYYPGNESLLPSASDYIEIRVHDERTILSLSTDDHQGYYGDMVTLSGSLNTEGGLRLPGQSVEVYADDDYIGSVDTDNEGLFSFPLVIDHNTPSGLHKFYALYHKPGADSVFQGSGSMSFVIEILARDTSIAVIVPDTGMTGGDPVRLTGKLVTDDGMPVKGATVSVYLDDRLLGTATTADDGSFDTSIRMPYRMPSEEPGIYATFTQPDNMALRGSRSEVKHVRFISLTPALDVDMLPSILFKGDVINVTGMVSSAENGIPMPGEMVTLEVSGAGAGSVASDDNGRFIKPYVVSGNERSGDNTINVMIIEGGSAVASYSQNVFIVPLDRGFVSVIAIGLALAAIMLMLAVIARVTGYYKKLRPRRYEALPAVRPEDEELTKPGQKIDAEEPPFILEDNIGRIRALVNEGSRDSAMVEIYRQIKNTAVRSGIDVPDTLTHREVYDRVAIPYPALSTPLKYIIDLYERVVYGDERPANVEFEAAVNGFMEVYILMMSKNPELTAL